MARRRNRESDIGSLVLGVILIIAGAYFRNYAPQNFSCNAASAFGVKTPTSCVWYQTTFMLRDWCIALGILATLFGGIGIYTKVTGFRAQTNLKSRTGDVAPLKTTGGLAPGGTQR